MVSKRLKYILEHIQELWVKKKMKIVQKQLNEALNKIKTGDVVLCKI